MAGLGSPARVRSNSSRKNAALTEVRSYSPVVHRLIRLTTTLPNCRLKQIGTAVHGTQCYPLFMVSLAVGPETNGRRRAGGVTPQRPLRVCLAAGIHGDERGGVDAILHWLEALPTHRSRLPRAELTIFPCINPSGYVHNRRSNDDGIDLNRQYKNRRAPIEVRVVRRALAGRRFDLSVEFHEDVDSHGFYLYELTSRQRGIGRRLIKEASKTLPINHADEIEGSGAQAGIIRRNLTHIRQRTQQWPHALYLFHLGTPRCLTLETPVTVPMSRRRGVHAGLLTMALRLSARHY